MLEKFPFVKVIKTATHLFIEQHIFTSYVQIDPTAFTEKGWYGSDTVETNDECRERVLSFYKSLKEEAPKVIEEQKEGEDCPRWLIISHANFLSILQGNIMNTVFPDKAKYFCLVTNAVSILEVNKDGIFDMPVQNFRF